MDRYQYAARPLAVSSESANDILWATYRWMSVGLAITGLVAWLVSRSPTALSVVVENRIVFYGLMFAQIGLVLAFSSVATRVSTAAAAAMFFATTPSPAHLRCCLDIRLVHRDHVLHHDRHVCGPHVFGL